MRICPFQPLVPRDNHTAIKLVCPPHDGLSQIEAKAYLNDNPQSFMSIVRPDAIHPQFSFSDPRLYEAASNKLETLRKDNLIIRPSSPCLYIHEQQINGQIHRGIVALASVYDYCERLIKPHEQTRKVNEKGCDLFVSHLFANAAPVILFYPDVDLIDTIVTETIQEPALFDVSSCVARNRIWPVSLENTVRLVSAFRRLVPKAYIADGHHRVSNAARNALEYGVRCGDTDASSWFLSVFFPASQLKIHSFNRLVKGTNGLSIDLLKAKIDAVARVEEMGTPPSDSPAQPGIVFMYIGSKWYSLSFDYDGNDIPNCVDSLDAKILQDSVLNKILGINDPTKSERMEFVGGIHGVKHLAQRVDEYQSHGTAIGFALSAVSVEQLMDIADRDEIMPPKSTWFEPKLGSGFFVHTLR